MQTIGPEGEARRQGESGRGRERQGEVGRAERGRERQGGQGGAGRPERDTEGQGEAGRGTEGREARAFACPVMLCRHLRALILSCFRHCFQKLQNWVMT